MHKLTCRCAIKTYLVVFCEPFHVNEIAPRTLSGDWCEIYNCYLAYCQCIVKAYNTILFNMQFNLISTSFAGLLQLNGACYFKCI